MTEKTNMYEAARTWNPFKGCRFDCIYCRPSFQRQAKRQKHLCRQCYNYEPHCHPDRLTDIPSAEIVFVAGNADIAFCPPDFVHKILDAIENHNSRCPGKTYYLQSKQPTCFQPFLQRLPPNVILVTTLETNRDDGYELISKAPPPSVRYAQFLGLPYPRKVITVEPVMDFDVDVFPQWIIDAPPEYVWLGVNSRPHAVQLPEPTQQQLTKLEQILVGAGIEIKHKTMPGDRRGRR
jgi:hypothetical protein